MRTVQGLLEPGKLTEDYLAGRRARYVTPVRTYLAMSLLFFLTVSFPVPDATTADVYVDGQLIGDREARPKERSQFGFQTVDPTSAVGRKMEEWLGSPSQRWRQMSPQELLDGFFNGVERSLPRTLILFVPFLALVLKLLYIRTGRLYYDHLIFSLHFQSFLFLALIAAGLLNAIALRWLISAHWAYLACFALLAPAYLFAALKRAYNQGGVLTLVKALLLGLIYVVLTVLVSAVTMLMAFYQM